MSMLKNHSNTDLDDGPHTLRSDLHSEEIPICRPSHQGSMSLISNPLQISQSPTRGILASQHNSRVNTLDTQSSCVTANCENGSSLCMSIPQDTWQVPHTRNKEEIPHTRNKEEMPHTTNEEEITPRCHIHPRIDTKKEMLVSEENYSDEQIHVLRQRPTTTEDFNISPDPPSHPHPELFYTHSSGTSPHHNVNPLSTAFSNAGFNPLSVSYSLSNSGPTPVCSSDIPSNLKFFSFVILHVPEDQEVASRVCLVLQQLDVGEGTTFCEGFETPGVSPLSCLEDAVESSAYIVLLLTNGFLSKWGVFQTNVVLMNSIQDLNKSGSVIPFFPHLRRPVAKLPLCLKSLFALDEDSPSFKNKVQNTFKQDVIKRHYKRWRRAQNERAFENSLRETTDQLNYLQHLQNISREHKNAMEYISAQMLPMIHNILPPHLIQRPQIIQISNASNVQIGNQNSMNVQQLGNEPIDKENSQEGDENAQN